MADGYFKPVMTRKYQDIRELRADFIGSVMQTDDGVTTFESIILNYLDGKVFEFSTYDYQEPKHMTAWEVTIFGKTPTIKSQLKISFNRHINNSDFETRGGYMGYSLALMANKHQDSFEDERTFFVSNVMDALNRTAEHDVNLMLEVVETKIKNFSQRIQDSRQEMLDVIQSCMIRFNIPMSAWERIRNAVYAYAQSCELSWDTTTSEKNQLIEPYMRSLTFLFD